MESVGWYVNTTLKVPQYSLEDQQHDEWSVATSLVLLCAATLCVAFHLVRLWNGRYVRSLGPTYMFLVIGALLETAFELRPMPNWLVASWTMGLFAASEWLTTMLKLSETLGGCAALGGVVVGMNCALLLLVFEPVRTIHHILMVALTAAATVVAFSRRNNKFVRLASFCWWASSLGPLFWEVESTMIVRRPPLVVLHLYRIGSMLSFFVCTGLSYRFRKNDPAQLVEDARTELVTSAHLAAQTFHSAKDNRV